MPVAPQQQSGVNALNDSKVSNVDEALKFALENSNVGFWSWNAKDDTIYLSERTKIIYGYPEDSTILNGETLRERIHADDRERLSADFESVFARKGGGNSLEGEYRLAPESGDHAWVRLNAQITTDKAGNPERISGSILDISNEVERREKYRKSKNELRLIFDNVPARIWYKDAHNKILRLNAKAAESMNLTVDEAEGADTYDLFPDMAKKYHDDDLLAINSGEPILGILEEYTPADGQRGWVRTDKIPYKDPKTGEDFLFVTSTDISQERNAENAIRESEQRFQLAAQGAGVGIWDWPLNDQGTFWVSHLLCNDLGIPPNNQHFETIDQFLSLVQDDDRADLESAFRTHFATRDSFELECRFETASQKLHWFKVSGQAKWDDDGQATRMIGSIVDINDLKEAQLNLEKYTRELEAANKDLDHFVYVASHDLKAPLRGIDNLASWLEEDIGDNITPDLTRGFKSLHGRVSRMETLLADILSFARAGKQLSNPERIDTSAVIDEVISWVKVPEAFTIKKDTPFPEMITVRSVYEHVCLNLISNSIKHHDKKEGLLLLACYDRIDYFEFTVIDDGPGIPKEYHDYVFEIFKKLKARDEVEGSGIGLAIVKKMVESIGGRIWIKQNSHNTGTAFHFSIPKNLHYTATLPQ